MNLKYFIPVSLFLAICAQATDTVTPLDVKMGLWEATTVTTMSGELPMTPEQLAKLTPEQRASLQKAINPEPHTDTHKECVTKEKLNKDLMFGSDREGCSRTITTSSSTKLEAKLHCDSEQAQTDGTIVMDVLSSESVKGDMDAVVMAKKHPMHMHVSFTSKYLSSSCGSVQP